jgi:selenide,water dikinase
LADVLATLPQADHPNLLVGFNTADDAGVYRLSDTQALVQTVDFFPPIVDDPYCFGQIAAANALSDVYAMGGVPLTALNIVGFPLGVLPAEILTEILRGGNDKVLESGAVVVGGHSIKDKELKFGLAVTGMIDPRRIITNAGARAGDVLFLTKALGTGIITTAIKRDAVEATVADTAIRQMAALNKAASEAMIAAKASAATDITGYGLLGHAGEMAAASKVTIRIFASKLPVLPDALRLAGLGMNPGGANDNREFLKGKVSMTGNIDPRLEAVLYDPQTSGGLLIAVAESSASRLKQALQAAGLTHEAIGRVVPAQTYPLVVEP